MTALPTAGPPRTILVADDESHVRNLLARLFEGSGFRVRTVPDGRAALEVLGDPGHPVDLLITDVSMPGLSGPELILEARARRPGLKIICLTARVNEETLTGDVHYLPKPFTLAGLAKKVSEVMGQAGR